MSMVGRAGGYALLGSVPLVLVWLIMCRLAPTLLIITTNLVVIASSVVTAVVLFNNPSGWNLSESEAMVIATRHPRLFQPPPATPTCHPHPCHPRLPPPPAIPPCHLHPCHTHLPHPILPPQVIAAVLLIFALLNLIWLWCIRKQIAFTATLLKSVASVLMRTPELLLVQLLMAGAVLGVMALWGGAYIELLALMDEYDADHKSDAGAVGYWAAGNIWALVSLFWVQVCAPHLALACISPRSPRIYISLHPTPSSGCSLRCSTSHSSRRAPPSAPGTSRPTPSVRD